MKTLVFDASPIIAIVKELGRIDILEKLCLKGYRIVITNYVARELLDPDIKILIKSIPCIEIAHVKEETINSLPERPLKLGKADLSVVAYCLINNEVIPIIDDKELKNYARKFIDKVHGTLWLLKELFPKEKIIPQHEIKELIKKLCKSRFRMPIEECIEQDNDNKN